MDKKVNNTHSLNQDGLFLSENRDKSPVMQRIALILGAIGIITGSEASAQNGGPQGNFPAVAIVNSKDNLITTGGVNQLPSNPLDQVLQSYEQNIGKEIKAQLEMVIGNRKRIAERLMKDAETAGNNRNADRKAELGMFALSLLENTGLEPTLYTGKDKICQDAASSDQAAIKIAQSKIVTAIQSGGRQMSALKDQNANKMTPQEIKAINDLLTFLYIYIDPKKPQPVNLALTNLNAKDILYGIQILDNKIPSEPAKRTSTSSNTTNKKDKNALVDNIEIEGPQKIKLPWRVERNKIIGFTLHNDNMVTVDGNESYLQFINSFNLAKREKQISFTVTNLPPRGEVKTAFYDKNKKKIGEEILFDANGVKIIEIPKGAETASVSIFIKPAPEKQTIPSIEVIKTK